MGFEAILVGCAFKACLVQMPATFARGSESGHCPYGAWFIGRGRDDHGYSLYALCALRRKDKEQFILPVDPVSGAGILLLSEGITL